MTPTPKETSTIRSYHAHVYFDTHGVSQARALCEAATQRFGLTMGQMHEKPVGPHPDWSCQLAFAAEHFGAVVPWLALNRGGLVVFVHPETGDDLADHRDHAIWLGDARPLDLNRFTQPSTPCALCESGHTAMPLTPPPPTNPLAPEPLRLQPVNAGVFSVHGADGAHLGNLKQIGSGWKFKAIGHDAAGHVEPGGGPLTAGHNAVFSEPDTAAVNAKLARLLD